MLGENMDTNTQEKTLNQKIKKPFKLTRAGLISIIASSAVALAAIVTTLVLCLSQRTIFMHINDVVLEYSIKTNATFNEPSDLPLADGEIILGYYCDKEFTVPFDFDQKIKNDTDIYVKTHQYNKQTITFNGNGIDINIPAVTKYETTKLNLPDMSEYQRNGYSFAGWATYYNANPDYDLLTDEDFYFKDLTNISLYAVWKPITYTITVNRGNETTIYYNGTTVKLSVPIEIKYTILDDITLPTAEKKHTTFTGWNISQDDSPSNWETSASQDSLNLGKGMFGNVSLSMKYEWNTYRLIFDVDDARKSLFTGTDWGYLVNPQSESDYVYGVYNEPFSNAFKWVNNEKYYVFKQDPTDIKSNYNAPHIEAMGKDNKYWESINEKDNKPTQVNKKGSTKFISYKVVDNCITFTPVWRVLKITLYIVDPISGNLDENFTNYELSTRNINAEYGKTIELPTPMDKANGSNFVGWYSQPTGGTSYGTSITWTDLSLTRLNLYSRWG